MTGNASGRAPRTAFFRPDPAPSGRAGRPKLSKDACLGRSHRSKPGKAKLKEAIDRTRARACACPPIIASASCAGSDTGAVEMALWSLLGPRPVDVLAWESFGEDWVTDVAEAAQAEGSRAC